MFLGGPCGIRRCRKQAPDLREAGGKIRRGLTPAATFLMVFHELCSAGDGGARPSWKGELPVPRSDMGTASESTTTLPPELDRRSTGQAPHRRDEIADARFTPLCEPDEKDFEGTAFLPGEAAGNWWNELKVRDETRVVSGAGFAIEASRAGE